MSPIIELQRRMVEAGRIRAGEKGAKGEPRKLDKWRLTSKDEVRLHAAAKLWGGESRPWEGHAGEFELYTDTASLPIMLLPGQVPTTWYELWSKGGCQRRCDGVHEVISDSVCLCGEERECKPYTRLSVLLPDLPGIGSWLLSSTGWNAAAELAGAADLLQRATAQGVLIPARLRLEQRTQVTGGQTRRFAVPVIDIDTSFRELLGGNQGGLSVPSEQPALPSGYTPIERVFDSTVSLADGLREAETQTLAKPPRVPLAEDDGILDDEPGAASSPSPEAPQAPKPPKPTQRQTKNLDKLVGTLRKAGHITTEQVWARIASMRGMDVDNMIEIWKGVYVSDGETEERLHWSPLRDSLTREEASGLIDRLERYESNVGSAA